MKRRSRDDEDPLYIDLINRRNRSNARVPAVVVANHDHHWRLALYAVVCCSTYVWLFGGGGACGGGGSFQSGVFRLR